MQAMRGKFSAFAGSDFLSRFLCVCALMIVIGSTMLLSTPALAQADQGAITGTILDPQGRAVPNADLTLTHVDTGLVLTRKTDQNGVYVFSPIKIGHYTITCAAPGFKTETHSGLMLNVNERLGDNFHLAIGQQTETVTVSAGDRPLLQTEDSSTGQVVSTKVINETPLNQRNYVFIAQLSAGVAQTPGGGSRGQGNGDFNANGLRADQNDFILDGVDNNSSAIDFLNGASYVIKPPPDALAEFKVQTGSYSAELGHSAGAVLNASIKSGSNAFHGDLWEYFRNDALDARSFMAPPGPLPKYRQNQFGATIGGPIVRNHLFFFGDFEANRIIIGNSGLFTVPTALMRQGNFTELLNPALTGTGAITLYQAGSGGSQLQTCDGQQNMFCTNQQNSIAAKYLNLFPSPNTNNGKTYQNYTASLNQINNTTQWDGRMDWNATSRDQAFARLSYSNNPTFTPVPFGILDGGGYGSDGPSRLKSMQFALSETHVFSPSVSNEIRFSFLYGAFIFGITNQNVDVSSQLGLGGVPFSKGFGGLPWMSIGGLSDSGAQCCSPVQEHANNSELLDNFTKIAGNHALKVGFQFQKIRSGYAASGFPRGWYQYTGFFTSNVGAPLTGYGAADFLADYQTTNALSTIVNLQQFRWYRSGYFQDDWKITPRLTLNLGLRYDNFQPFTDKHDNQANFVITSKGLNSAGLGTGTAEFQVPKGSSATFNSSLTSLFAQDNISITRSGNRALATGQSMNFAPRVGFAFSVTPKTVVRGAYGLFYGGLQNGFGANIGLNPPFSLQANFVPPTCLPGGPCQGDGLTLKDGFSQYIANGLVNLPVHNPTINGIQSHIKWPYTHSYNLSFQQALSSSLTGTVGYVGSTSRHLQENGVWYNTPLALAAPGTNTQPYQPFPDVGVPGSGETMFIASSNYNSLQATLEKRYTQGLYFLTSYTYSHSLDNDLSAYLGIPENINIVPLSFEYGNSDWDTRHRLTLNANYQLPVGAGRQFLNKKGILDEMIGGWAIGAMFVAQSGNPITVFSNNGTPAGAYFARPLLTRNPYKGGGTPPANNPALTSCPAKVKTLQNWFNPCAFTNPLPGSDILPGQLVTSPGEAIKYLGSSKNPIYGPGFNRLNTSLFKRFSSFREQYAEFRADIFNTYNSPAYGQPAGNIYPTGGLITGTRTLGANSPDGRFIQLALKYVF